MGTPSILTICVNYHRDEETIDFVQGLLAQRGVSDQKVIVVDNNEHPLSEGPLRDLAQTDRRILLYVPGKNLGYYGGAASGLQEYLEDHSFPEWIIVCNTDLRFARIDFITNLLTWHRDANYEVIAPSILSEFTGKDQNPYLKTRPSRYRIVFSKWIFRYYPIAFLWQALSIFKKNVIRVVMKSSPKHVKNISRSGASEVKQIYAPHGSFVVFNRKYFERGGTLNHGLFLFAEENFVAETARNLGMTIVYDPRLQVIHKEHAVTGRFFWSRRMARFVRDAAAYCADTLYRD